MSSIDSDKIDKLLTSKNIETDVSVIEGYLTLENLSDSDYDRIINEGIIEDMLEEIGAEEKEVNKSKNMIEVLFEDIEE